DCDPGYDDALAILLAARHFDVLGVTAVAGNVDVERTTLNARRVVDLTGLPIPVARGCARPLAQDPIHVPEIHGRSGLDGYEFPPPRARLDGRHAVEFLIDTARARDGVTLIATGPLTNVAEALRRAPDLARCIREISLMGGSVTLGNMTPAAEFNIWFDPEAADAVFRSGIPLWMCGLNLTRQATVDVPMIEGIGALGTRTGKAIAALLRSYLAGVQRSTGAVAAAIHDPCAVAILLEPAVISWVPMHVVVECRGEHTRGMTVCDARHVPAFNPTVAAGGLPRGLPANARVAVALDAPGFARLLSDALASFP
ncbi:MAG TPA: nucleoside hydrolase, partial [bacterium]|nr:nucleoside hydrolase [bacterium]